MKIFSKIESPLGCSRTRIGDIGWDNRKIQEIETLQRSIAERVELHFPNDVKPFLLWTDSSDQGIGAWVSQKDKENALPICFASQALSNSEKNYSNTKKEVWGISWALKRLRSYVFGRNLLCLEITLHFIFDLSKTWQWYDIAEGQKYFWARIRRSAYPTRSKFCWR